MVNRGPGRPPLTSRDHVVRAACALADMEGLDAVSMRTVGKRLGVTPMGLYRHVADKKTLLEAMVEQVAGEYDLDSVPGTWRDALAGLARQQKGLIERHPWLPDLASRFHRMGPATLAYVERLLELFEEAGVPDTSLLETVGLFNGLVTALCVASNAPTQTDPEAGDDLMALLESGRYPRFAALAGQPHLDMEREFDRLVLRLIEGLTRLDR